MHFDPKFLKRLIFIWEKATFFCEQIFLVVAGTWLGERRVCFFWARNLSFWPKNPILATRPNFGQLTVCSPWRDRSFPTSGAIFDFLFPSYSRFRKKKPGWCIKKSSPSPLWGHRLPVTALTHLTVKAKIFQGCPKSFNIWCQQFCVHLFLRDALRTTLVVSLTFLKGGGSQC